MMKSDMLTPHLKSPSTSMKLKNIITSYDE